MLRQHELISTWTQRFWSYFSRPTTRNSPTAHLLQIPFLVGYEANIFEGIDLFQDT